MSAPPVDLGELLKNVLAAGANGMSVRTDEVVLVHCRRTHKAEGTCPTQDEVMALLRLLATSRELRQFRDEGLVHFLCTTREGIKLLGGARNQEDRVHIELRRMAT